MSPLEQRSPSSDLVGATLDHFRIVGRLGEGGMGVVYRAIDERLRRPVALKVLPDDAMRDEARRRRFMREARSAAAVVHSNVAAVYEVDESGGHVYIAMELVEGTSLRHELARARLAIPECVRIAKGIARALAKAHEKGIVHRDLKPDNVMLNEDREVKVLDFGLAKLLDVDDAESLKGLDDTASHDTAGRLMGTPAYMSPEQATGKRIDARSDVFSFGVILYEMLTGRRPFEGTSVMETLVAVARDEPAPPSSLTAIPAAVELVLFTCLQKDPERRFASGRELAAALDAFEASLNSGSDLGSLPTLLAANVPSLELLAKVTTGKSLVHPARKRKGISLAALALLAVVGIGWGLLHRGPRGVGQGTTPGSASAAAYAPKPEAVTLFDQATREEREGRHDLACGDFRRATDADLTFARAALEAAQCNSEDPRTGRAYFHRAWALRATLAPNNQAYLAALEPLFQRDPEDRREALTRMQDAAKKFPNDPRIHFEISALIYALGSYEAHIPEMETSLRLDPSQPTALEILADHSDYSGDFERAHAAIERCLDLIPGELGCLEEQAWLHGEEGQCAAMESDARRMVTVDPAYESGFQLLANALYAEGSSLSSVRELLQRKHEALAPEARGPSERTDAILVDLLAGDFVSAETAARAWSDAVKDSTVAADHGEVARLLVLIEEESGRTADAAADAQTYLDGRDGWEPNARFEDWAMSKEPTPMMLAARLHVGAITQAVYDRELARTVDRWEARVVPHLRNFIWLYAYAVPTETPAEGKGALEKRAAYEPLPPFTPLTLLGADVGRTDLLAGRVDDALEALQRATQNCSPVDHPLESTRAHYFLGQAREAKKDTAGACAAYGVVRDRWEHAKPRSVTAQKAMARLAALGCDARKK